MDEYRQFLRLEPGEAASIEETCHSGQRNGSQFLRLKSEVHDVFYPCAWSFGGRWATGRRKLVQKSVQQNGGYGYRTATICDLGNIAMKRV